MTEPTYEELKAKLADLEAKNKRLQEKARKPTLMVTHDGLFQIRWLEKQSVNLNASTVRWIVEHAQEIIPFLTANANLLTNPSDTPEVTEQKEQARLKNLETDNPVVRPKKDISWREK